MLAYHCTTPYPWRCALGRPTPPPSPPWAPPSPPGTRARGSSTLVGPLPSYPGWGSTGFPIEVLTHIQHLGDVIGQNKNDLLNEDERMEHILFLISRLPSKKGLGYNWVLSKTKPAASSLCLNRVWVVIWILSEAKQAASPFCPV